MKVHSICLPTCFENVVRWVPNLVYIISYTVFKWVAGMHEHASLLCLMYICLWRKHWITAHIIHASSDGINISHNFYMYVNKLTIHWITLSSVKRQVNKRGTRGLAENESIVHLVKCTTHDFQPNSINDIIIIMYLLLLHHQSTDTHNKKWKAMVH